MNKEEIAKEMLLLHKQIDELQKPLDEYKELLRKIANGDNLDIIIESLGRVIVTKPRESVEKTVFELNEQKINSNKEIKKLLIERGILTEESIKTKPAKASVNIKPNV